MENCNILSEYIKQKDYNKVKQFIQHKNINLNTVNCIGDPPLHYAVRLSQVAHSKQNTSDSAKYQQIAELLINNGAQLTTKNEFNDIFNRDMYV